MKLCRDCRHSEFVKQCVHEKLRTEPSRVDGVPFGMNTSASVVRHWSYLCGEDAKWFEPRLPDLPTGYRFITEQENKYGKIQAGDKIWNTNGWVDYEDSVVGERFSDLVKPKCRRIVPALAKCPEGHDASITRVGDNYFVVCWGAACWRGPYKLTGDEAAEAWNNVMAKVQTGKDATTRPA